MSDSDSSATFGNRSTTRSIDRLDTYHSLLIQNDATHNKNKGATSGHSSYHHNIASSTLSQRDLNKWFQPLMQAGVTAPFSDEDEASLLTSILKQVSVDDECVRSEEELQVIWDHQVPASVQNLCDSAANILCPALEKVQHLSTSSENFCLALWEELYDLRVSSRGLADYDAASKVLKSMFIITELFIRPSIGDSAKNTHRAWSELLREIFQLVLGTDLNDSGPTIREPLLQYNGLSTVLLKLPNADNLPRFTSCKPDLLVEMQHMVRVERRLIKDVVLCVAEVKSPKCKASHGSDKVGSSDSSSSISVTDSDSECLFVTRDHKHDEETDSDNNQIRYLKSQHFLQLLSCMAPINLTIGPQKKFCPMKNAFGLYMNGFKIYPTSLNAVHVTYEETEKLKCADDYWVAKFIGQEIPGVKMPSTDKGPIQLYMACSKYLNVFNPLHFKVLLRYLQVLVWHDKMHTELAF